MAILIPAMGSCVSRMSSGERRLAERLEQKLDDYFLWYDVPVSSTPRATVLRADKTSERMLQYSVNSASGAADALESTFFMADPDLI